MRSLQLAARTFAHVPDLIATHANERPQGVAVLRGCSQVTYKDLDIITKRIAAALQRDGAVPKRPKGTPRLLDRCNY